MARSYNILEMTISSVEEALGIKVTTDQAYALNSAFEDKGLRLMPDVPTANMKANGDRDIARGRGADYMWQTMRASAPSFEDEYMDVLKHREKKD